MKNLKSIRRKKELSQHQLAQLLHIGASTVCRWEKGETVPNLCQFLALCRILNCTPAHLCSNADNKEIPIFRFDSSLVETDMLTSEINHLGCCFGLVLPYDIPPRFKIGDICCFSFADADSSETLVLCCDDNYNPFLLPFKEMNDALHLIASCRFMHFSI